MLSAVDIPPRIGEIVRVRSRRYLVEDVSAPVESGDDTLIRLSCLEDDAEGEELQVLWERELDSARLDEADWSKLTRGEFDPTRFFAASNILFVGSMFTESIAPGIPLVPRPGGT